VKTEDENECTSVRWRKRIEWKEYEETDLDLFWCRMKMDEPTNERTKSFVTSSVNYVFSTFKHFLKEHANSVRGSWSPASHLFSNRFSFFSLIFFYCIYVFSYYIYLSYINSTQQIKNNL